MTNKTTSAIDLVERLRAKRELISAGATAYVGLIDDTLDTITRLQAANLALRAAISWLEMPFVDGSTTVPELQKRVQFCIEDAKRVPSEGGE